MSDVPPGRERRKNPPHMYVELGIPVDRRKMKGQESRQKIIDTTISIIAREGYYSATFRNISKQTGISTGAIQYHFPSTHELIDGIFQETVVEHTKKLSEAMRGEGSLRSRLMTNFEAYLDWATLDAYVAATRILLIAKEDADLAAKLAPVLRRLAIETTDGWQKPEDKAQLSVRDTEDLREYMLFAGHSLALEVVFAGGTANPALARARIDRYRGEFLSQMARRLDELNIKDA